MNTRLLAALGTCAILVPVLLWSQGDRPAEPDAATKLPKALGAIQPRLSPDGSSLAFSYQGEIWTGPHPGIPYVLRAGGGDVYYTSEPRENVTKKVLLSKERGEDAAKAFARRIQEVKGWAGGRFYINEFQELFAPLTGADGVHYVYIGPLALDEPWFYKFSPP